MKRRDLSDAIGGLSEEIVEEIGRLRARARRRRFPRSAAPAIAAGLLLCVCLGAVFGSRLPFSVSAPSEPTAGAGGGALPASSAAAAAAEEPVYRLTPGELSQPFLFAGEDVPCYGIPYASQVNLTISNQLVRVYVTARAGECPVCGGDEWALIYWGSSDAAIDTLCWAPLCRLHPYTQEDAAVLTYPVRVREGLTVEIRGKEVSSDTLGDARMERRGETVLLSWVGGNACELSPDDVLLPSPETVNALADDLSWDDLFAP